MKIMNTRMCSTALAAVLGLSLGAGAALAQQAQETPDSQQQRAQSDTGAGQVDGAPQGDAVVATVGDAEILGSDVMFIIGLLPPQMQSQPPETLVPVALSQLILRELILEEAREQNLAEDPEVIALVETAGEEAEEDAMVQVWIDREMADVVTDEAVQQAYETAQAQGQELPPLEEIRPQIEQFLRQQAMQEIQAELRQGADIVLYDATGRPLEQQQGQDAQDGGSGQSGSADASGEQTESQ